MPSMFEMRGIIRKLSIVVIMAISTISLMACTNQNSKPATDYDLGMERALNTKSGWHIRKTKEFEKQFYTFIVMIGRRIP